MVVYSLGKCYTFEWLERRCTVCFTGAILFMDKYRAFDVFNDT